MKMKMKIKESLRNDRVGLDGKEYDKAFNKVFNADFKTFQPDIWVDAFKTAFYNSKTDIEEETKVFGGSRLMKKSYKVSLNALVTGGVSGIGRAIAESLKKYF